MTKKKLTSKQKTPIKKGREFFDLDINEVHLVDEAAHGGKFLVMKSAKGKGVVALDPEPQAGTVAKPGQYVIVKSAKLVAPAAETRTLSECLAELTTQVDAAGGEAPIGVAENILQALTAMPALDPAPAPAEPEAKDPAPVPAAPVPAASPPDPVAAPDAPAAAPAPEPTDLKDQPEQEAEVHPPDTEEVTAEEQADIDEVFQEAFNTEVAALTEETG